MVLDNALMDYCKLMGKSGTTSPKIVDNWEAIRNIWLQIQIQPIQIESILTMATE